MNDPRKLFEIPGFNPVTMKGMPAAVRAKPQTPARSLKEEMVRVRTHFDAAAREKPQILARSSEGEMVRIRVRFDRGCPFVFALQAMGGELQLPGMAPKPPDAAETVDEAEVVFFRRPIGFYDGVIYQEYISRELEPADPYALAAINEADPTFAETHNNITYWREGDSWAHALCYCFRKYLSLSHVEKIRTVHAGYGVVNFGVSWFLAGTPLRALPPLKS